MTCCFVSLPMPRKPNVNDFKVSIINLMRGKAKPLHHFMPKRLQKDVHCFYHFEILLLASFPFQIYLVVYGAELKSLNRQLKVCIPHTVDVRPRLVKHLSQELHRWHRFEHNEIKFRHF
jgi:hypothetical protein